MTISSETRKVIHSGNDSATSFAFTFKVFAKADLRVVLTDTNMLESDLVLDSDYSVALNADQDNNPGGTVTYPLSGDPLATGEKLTVLGAIEFLQETDLQNGGGFFPNVIEDSLDRATILTQQLKERVDAAFTLPVSVGGVSTELPVPAANNVIGWNETATELQNFAPDVFASVVAYGTASADVFSGDGVTTQFVLSSNPAALNNLDVAIGGVTQTPTIDYTWSSGTTITFTTAPPSGTDNVLVRYMRGLAQGATTAEQVSYISADGVVRPISDLAELDNGKGARMLSFSQYGLQLPGGAAVSEVGFWSDVGDVNIWRLRDRLFVGDGADSSGSSTPTANETWITSQVGAHYLERAAQFLSVSSVGKYGGVFGSRSSDQQSYAPSGETCIGVASIAINDFPATSKTAWGAYLEAVRDSGVSGFTHGVEIAVKNKGSNITQTPYSFNNGGATHGAWFAGGSDPAYYGAPANPSSAAIMVVKNGSTWNRGIVFTKDSITGTDGVTGTGIAIQMAKGQKIDWQSAAGNAVQIWSEVTTTANAVSLVFFEGSTSFVNNNKLLFKIDTVNAPANSLGVAPIGTGGAPNLYARGDDTNIDIALIPKGTGTVRFGTFTSNADAPINGYITIKDSGGTTRKLATIA